MSGASEATDVPAGGSVPATWPVGSVPSASACRTVVKPAVSRFRVACSTVCPVTSGTVRAEGPEPTRITISLLVAESCCAAGTVPTTRSSSSLVEACGIRRTFSKPASASVATASS